MKLTPRDSRGNGIVHQQILEMNFESMRFLDTNVMGFCEYMKKLLTKLVIAQHEIDSITALENFILGFRPGIRMMVECMDGNDGDVRNGDA